MPLEFVMFLHFKRVHIEFVQVVVNTIMSRVAFLGRQHLRLYDYRMTTTQLHVDRLPQMNVQDL